MARRKSTKSPSNPTLGTDEQPNLRNSKGFEAMATDGRYLYPIFEGYLDSATDKRERVISQFDTETGKYTGKTWNYLAEGDDALIGVNNRSLRTFEVDLATTGQLAALSPDGALLVAESGLFTPQDVARVADAGARALLVGESLMRQADVEAATRALLA